MQGLNLIQQVAVWSLPVLFAITVHEVAHGWVARRLGDPTAMMLGRLTLNPLKHIDPIGTVILPLLLVITHAGVIFGWAKPVPITAQNLKHPKRDMALVALAGPLANFVMMLLWAIIMKSAILLQGNIGQLAMPMYLMGEKGIEINILLLVLNLLPLLPLDGGRVVSGLLPDKLSWKYSRTEPYGLVILLGLMIMNPYIHFLDMVLGPPITMFQTAVVSTFGL
jgi:Zn-dependent protease